MSTFDELAARCAQQGWELRACAEGYELLGNGAPAVWRRLESCAGWVERWTGPAGRAADPLDEDLEQASFLMAA